MAQFNKRVYSCYFCGEIKENDVDIPEPIFKDNWWLNNSMENRKFCCQECYEKMKQANEQRPS